MIITDKLGVDALAVVSKEIDEQLARPPSRSVE